MKEFLNLLFDQHEDFCPASSLTDVGIMPVPFWAENLMRQVHPPVLWFSINPLKDSRRDSNVTAFRNILIEFDFGSTDDQLALLKKSGVPYSTLVHSGGKSLHAIISLETPMPDKDSYKELVKSIYAKLPGCDKANSNPSRFSRLPGVIRPDTGKEQSLLYLGKRITTDHLNAWLGPVDLVSSADEVYDNTIHTKKRIVSGYTRDLLMFGAEPGTRNSRTFAAACDLVRCGYSSEEIVAMIAEAVDLPISEIKQCITSATRTVRKETS